MCTSYNRHNSISVLSNCTAFTNMLFCAVTFLHLAEGLFSASASEKHINHAAGEVTISETLTAADKPKLKH